MKRICFVVNPISGGKDKGKILAAVRKHLDGSLYSAEFLTTERAGQAEELARSCRADVVVAVGGDGTVSEVARGLLGTDKTLGIIPCGSGDGLALHLGISRNPSRAVRQLVSGREELMDYGLVEGRRFFCTTGVGLDAKVAWDFARGTDRGLWQYIRLAWKTWLGFRPETYEVEVDGERVSFPAVIITVGNANQWGNQARITSLASVKDGMLDVTAVLPFKTLEIPLLALKLLTGRMHTSRRVRLFRGRHIVIRREAPGPAHLDGDPCAFGEKLEMELVPGALRVLVPASKKDKI